MKRLTDMSLEELWQLFPIILKGYNPQYPDWYNEEKARLLIVLENVAVRRINHIGSTSVVGLVAKPIIDILLELPADYDLDQVVDLLQRDGWLLMARYG